MTILETTSSGLRTLASATSINLGDPISGTLASGNETALYRFNALAGDQIALNRQALNGGSPLLATDRSLWRRDLYNCFSNSGTLTLPLSGTYTLLFEGQISANGASDYTFNVSSQGHTDIPALTGTALTLGAVTSGAISTAGQQNNYVFTIGNPTELYFNSLTNRSDLNWTLIGPRGTEISLHSFQSSDAGDLWRQSGH